MRVQDVSLVYKATFVYLIVINGCGCNHPNHKWWQDVIPPDYEEDIPPYDFDESNNTVPVEVLIYFIPRLVSSVSLKTMDFQMEYRMAVLWHDYRLKDVIRKEEHEVKTVPGDIAVGLWFPSINFPNCKGCEEKLLDPKKHRVLLMRVGNQQKVLVVLRGVPQFTCTFNLQHYPLDTQKCSLLLELEEFQEEVALRFRLLTNDAVNIPVPPEFILDHLEQVNCTENEMQYEYSIECVNVIFTFQREILPHLMLIYFPSMLVVILSWISFWLDPLVAGPRVSLGLTSLLTLATQFGVAQRELPPSHHLKALDVWMFTCMFFVFSSLLEFATLNVCLRHDKRDGDVEAAVQTSTPPLSASSAPPSASQSKKKAFKKRAKGIRAVLANVRKHFTTNYSCSSSAKRTDQVCRILFPIAFLLFNYVYWTHYR